MKKEGKSGKNNFFQKVKIVNKKLTKAGKSIFVE